MKAEILLAIFSRHRENTENALIIGHKHVDEEYTFSTQGWGCSIIALISVSRVAVFGDSKQTQGIFSNAFYGIYELFPPGLTKRLPNS